MTGERCDHCGKGLYWWNGFGWFCDWCGDYHPNGGIQRCEDVPELYKRSTPLPRLMYPKTVKAVFR